MFVAGGSLILMAQAPPPTPLKPPLGSGVFDWNQLVAKPTKIGARREVFDAPTATLGNLECHITTVNPGEAPHAPHRHPDEELIFIKEGTLEVMVNGVTRQTGPGSVVFFAANDFHGLRNSGTTPATYYVLRIVPHDLPGTATK
jgi:XRE family transcriptional regulator, regulator of sulfur utilization